ncbi:hypothetical protein Tco_0818219 [Tanacetum coccineum]
MDSKPSIGNNAKIIIAQPGYSGIKNVLQGVYREDGIRSLYRGVGQIFLSKASGCKDLWNACKQYGHVVDAFIPNKRSKAVNQPAIKERSETHHFGNTKDNGHEVMMREGGWSVRTESKSGHWGMKGFIDIDIKMTCGKTHWVRAIEIPGWTPDLDDQNDEESDSEDAECKEVFKKDFGESDEEVQGENDVSRVSDTDVEERRVQKPRDVASKASTKESLEYPPGFTPRENDVENVEMDNHGKSKMQKTCARSSERADVEIIIDKGDASF